MWSGRLKEQAVGQKSKQETKSNQTTTVAPPSWTMPGISAAAGKVTDALGAMPTSSYTGDFVAQPNKALTDQAVGAYTGAANTAGGWADYMSNMTKALGGASPVTTGTYQQGAGFDLNPVIQAAVSPLLKQLTEQTLPGIRSSALESGAYSGDRAMSLLPSMAASDTAVNAQNLGAQIGYQDYAMREAQRLAAYQSDQSNSLAAQQFNNNFGLASANAQSDLINQEMMLRASMGDLFSGAASTGTAADQAGINNALAKEQYNIQRPFQGLDIASALLAQLSGGYGTTTSNGTQTTTQSTGGLGSVVSGIAGLASLAGSFAMPGGGSLGGNLLGSLFSPKKAA